MNFIISRIGVLIVEMGVPIDRGLTHFLLDLDGRVFLVEMGVPIDRGLTQIL